MTNDKAIELIKDEYCYDCVWKDESEDHCDSCMVGDILKLLEQLEEDDEHTTKS